MQKADKDWIGRELFASEGKLVSNLKYWWHPPSPSIHGMPTPEPHFLRKLFLWMPRKMLLFDLKCPKYPNQSLRSKGIYNHVRLVLNLSDFYYLATEYMDCNECSGTFQAWDKRIMDQLPQGVSRQFPAVLTYKYAADVAIISLLRACTLGNSPSAMQNNLRELHSDMWLKRSVVYLSACKRHKDGLQRLVQSPTTYKDVPLLRHLPGARWFLAAYVRDVWMRLPQLLAAVTSITGRVIKIDSTKKLTGTAASWATSVGNEKGEILQCILTTSEGAVALQEMADGLMNRFEKAGAEPPQILYTDRDCCKEPSLSKYKKLFRRWNGLLVRLDIWHFMRRLALGCTSESHPLYGFFMSRLSGCIFEWDSDDYKSLVMAKKKEMIQAGVQSMSDKAAAKAVTREELARHCRRRTRGADVTTSKLESLFLALTGTTDVLGVPLLRKEMAGIWEEQKRHIGCIQDPPGIPLYTVVG